VTVEQTRHVTPCVTVRVTQGWREVVGRIEVAQWRDYRFGRGGKTAFGRSDTTFTHGSVAKVTRGSLQPNKKLPSVRAVRIWAKHVKKVGITYFSFEAGATPLLDVRCVAFAMGSLPPSQGLHAQT